MASKNKNILKFWVEGSNSTNRKQNGWVQFERSLIVHEANNKQQQQLTNKRKLQRVNIGHDE